MRLLLDTHVAIWALVAPERIPGRVRELMKQEVNSTWVSAISIWEISVKHKLGRVSSPPFSGREAIGFFENAGFGLLPVTVEHAAMVDNLPRLHADPFDRLLIAQALSEPMRLVSHDRQVAAYSDTVISL
ncbi:type II toxin-antitoxin system VapC family toxin [Mesorhizobium sp. YM1C-6-2]|uniref:type II toxin-antitoxin system VapC family toxin n=1 Tax=Mesorhizobium sp. YM1C-6-2 TaxID=1827501 RepID=UPI000EF1B4EE|nr:type II toxin-antitoxin system VapC family toxin [Mesorhizobium sp. YM1C-6-2]RLP25163.1 type II toxin-antitoxin system VapC family toxin [Mesorhizobium sp. YM1C-6-2]